MSDPLIVWTIYRHPRDYPDHYVVRRWRSNAGKSVADKNAHLAPDLDKAREFIPQGLHRLNRQPQDDWTIVETWI